MNVMNIIEVKKELYKSKAMAKLIYYIAGNLYYSIELENGTYKFPISTIENKTTYFPSEYEGDDEGEFEYIELSSDLGTTEFLPEVRGSELARWISMAMDSGEFIKID